MLSSPKRVPRCERAHCNRHEEDKGAGAGQPGAACRRDAYRPRSPHARSGRRKTLWRNQHVDRAGQGEGLACVTWSVTSWNSLGFSLGEGVK